MTTKLESAEEFAERILKGMGFDLDLIGDAPMHIANDIKSRDLDITHTAKESMREDAERLAKPRDHGEICLCDQCNRAAAIRAIPLTSDAPAVSLERE